MRLPELQRGFFQAIAGAHASGSETPGSSALESEIRGDERLGRAERIDIYARMYRARLVDVLAEDYPRVGVVVGPGVFGELAHAYVAAYPSTHPSLRWFGRHFADLLGNGSRQDLPDYLADLARLEWARLAVFDAPDAEVLTLDALRRLPSEAWAALRLEAIPALELLSIDWPVHRIWDAASAGPPPGDWQPETTALRVWRQGDTVYQASMDHVERTAFAYIRSGDPFVEMCVGLASVVSAQTAAATAGALVLRWIEDGLLRAVEVGR